MSDPSFPYGVRRRGGFVSDAPALVVRSVSVGYPGAETLALREVNLRAPVGTRVALVGPNGSGKSTLLKAAAGLLPVRSGEVRVHGAPVGDCRRRVAYLPQRGEIDWRFPINVKKLVMTGRYVRLGWFRRPGPRDRKAVVEVIERLGLGALAERQIGQLSGGQQQRALLARTLVQEADLLLLDEPFNAVDAVTRAEISEVLSELRIRGKTMIVATHDIGKLTSDFDGALYLRDGLEAPPEPGAFVGLSVGREATWTG